MLPEILTIFLLLLLNSFFALSEMAIVSANKSLLKQMERDGNKGATLAIKLAEDSGRFLSTVQVGITLVGILAGAYGGATIAEKLTDTFNAVPFIAPRGEGFAVFIVVTLITYFSVVIGELVPKQLALSNSEKLAVFVARPMTGLSKLCTPVVLILEHSANFLMAVLGIKKKDDDSVTEAEVKAVLSGGAESGVLEQSEHDMLQRIIRLGDRDVKSVMTHRMDIAFIDINDTPQEIASKMQEGGHVRYPVIDGNIDKVLGMVEAREIYTSMLQNSQVNVSDYLHNIGLLPETTHCLKALEIFKNSKIMMALVVDEYGTTQGIVTAADFLEAILGSLPSNYDEKEHAFITERADGSWLVEGITPVDEVHLTLGLEVSKDEVSYDTIAGYILHSFGKIPEEGQVFEKSSFRFEIVDMDGRRIDKVIMTKLK